MDAVCDRGVIWQSLAHVCVVAKLCMLTCTVNWLRFCFDILKADLLVFVQWGGLGTFGACALVLTFTGDYHAYPAVAGYIMCCFTFLYLLFFLNAQIQHFIAEIFTARSLDALVSTGLQQHRPHNLKQWGGHIHHLFRRHKFRNKKMKHNCVYPQSHWFQKPLDKSQLCS